MRVWGMGTCYGKDDDRVDSFVENCIAAIGWSEDDAIDLYAMMRDIEIGDIIYLKSSYPKKGKGKILRIKAIGKVTNPNKKFNGQRAIGVDYIKNFQGFDLALNEYNGKSGVYGCTFYQEYNPRIIEEILKRAEYLVIS